MHLHWIRTLNIYRNLPGTQILNLSAYLIILWLEFIICLMRYLSATVVVVGWTSEQFFSGSKKYQWEEMISHMRHCDITLSCIITSQPYIWHDCKSTPDRVTQYLRTVRGGGATVGGLGGAAGFSRRGRSKFWATTLIRNWQLTIFKNTFAAKTK